MGITELEQPAIVLIHGLIGTLRDLVPVFADHGVRSYAPDLLGYGALSQVNPEKINLDQQVIHLADWMDKIGLEHAHLVGHSVGGAVAMLFAEAYPSRVASIVSVEGNFSLSDAFWSAGVAGMSATDAEAMMTGFQDDLAAWLARSGIQADPCHLATAKTLLWNQPASTVQATARSVVEITGKPDYLRTVQAVFAGKIPVHLLAGERSVAGWNVPEWAREQAETKIIIPGGHLMMFEAQERFVIAVLKHR